MSRFRYVKGKIIKITGGDYNIYSRNGSINYIAAKEINFNGVEEGVLHTNNPVFPEPLNSLDADFDIKLELIEEDFVPLGIANYKGEVENDSIKFKLTVKGAGINHWDLVIKKGDDTIYELFSASIELPEVIITAKSKEGAKASETEADTPKPVFDRFWPAGEYIISWTGFDNNGIYDSVLMKSEEGFTVSITGQANFMKKTYTIEEPIKFTRKEVPWVDVKIYRDQKIINATLRVSMKDGGARGIKCTEQIVAPDPIIISKCPWDDIPKEDLISGRPPLKTRTRSYEQLEQLAMEGLMYHWGRNRNHAEGKNVMIDGEPYEVFISVQNIVDNKGDKEKEAMDDISLIYNTNAKWMRSGNPGSATLNPISWIGNLVSREAICYNVGYIKYSNGWGYSHDYNEDKEFKFTSAHELGHEILKSYGGVEYSYGHKESSEVYSFDQHIKDNAPEFPISGEIDIMPYYPNDPPLALYDKYVASEKDVLSLLWLTKIEIK